jgi:hypothetical protein
MKVVHEKENPESSLSSFQCNPARNQKNDKDISSHPGVEIMNQFRPKSFGKIFRLYVCRMFGKSTFDTKYVQPL